MSPDALHGCKDHLFDRMEARLTCYDRERRILWVNAYAASMAGSSPEDLVGVSCCRAWQNCSQPFQKCHVIQALESGLPKSVELDTPDGRSWFLTAYPMQGPDGRVEIVGEYGRDVTEEKRNQQLRDEINAITRHDLKGPAINAVTVAKLLDRGDNLTDTQRELLHELRHSGEHMLEIINQTLVLHKIDKGDLRTGTGDRGLPGRDPRCGQVLFQDRPCRQGSGGYPRPGGGGVGGPLPDQGGTGPFADFPDEPCQERAGGLPSR